MVTRDKKIHGKHIACFTFQLWLRATADTFDVLRLGEKTIFGLKDGQPFVKNEEKVVTLSMEEEGRFLPNVWNHMAWTYSKEQSLISVHKNCSFSTSQKCAMKVGR